MPSPKKSSAAKFDWPERSTGFTHKTKAALALLLARDPSRSSLTKLSADVEARRQAVAALEAELRGEDAGFDFKSDSLQNRLLTFFESKLGFDDAHGQLEIAEKARRRLLGKVSREALLGLHSRNKELESMVEGFSNYDLRLLNKAVLDDNPSDQLKTPEIVEVITRKLKEGQGEHVIKYLAARMEHHQSRMDSAAKQTVETTEVFNPALLVVAKMWTNPQRPLWLFPSKAAVKLIGKFTQHPLTPKAYNRLVRTRGLPRVPQGILEKFMSITLRDSDCNRLRNEYKEAIEISLSDVRRGRKPNG